jgi:hypothetical protein
MVSEDRLFIPLLQRFLEREGVAALLIRSRAGDLRALVDSEESQSLWDAACAQLFTWTMLSADLRRVGITVLFVDDWTKQLAVRELTLAVGDAERLQVVLEPDEQPRALPKLEVFISYAHEDEELRQQLVTHLRPLEREGLISGWHDRLIMPGIERHKNIDEHLNSARIILLLISPDFLASDYAYDAEVQRAMQRHHAKVARVIPIVLRYCDWGTTPFGLLEAVPTDGEPVTGKRWANRDEAFTIIARAVRVTAKELRETV